MGRGWRDRRRTCTTPAAPLAGRGATPRGHARAGRGAARRAQRSSGCRASRIGHGSVQLAVRCRSGRRERQTMSALGSGFRSRLRRRAQHRMPAMATSRIDLTNQFLIAMPGMADDTFAGAVVYLCEHTEKGALGLVINKPIDIKLRNLFEKVDLSLDRKDLAEQPV